MSEFVLFGMVIQNRDARHILIKTTKSSYTICANDNRQSFKMYKWLHKKSVTSNYFLADVSTDRDQLSGEMETRLRLIKCHELFLPQVMRLRTKWQVIYYCKFIINLNFEVMFFHRLSLLGYISTDKDEVTFTKPEMIFKRWIMSITGVFTGCRICVKMTVMMKSTRSV